MRRFVTEIYADNLEWLSTPRKVENTGEESSVGNSVASSDNSNLPF
jgi:single-stranded DNA-binding protein